MSEEAATLIDAFDDAVVLTAMTDVMDRAEFKAAHDKWSVSRAALLAYIERIERERDEAQRRYDDECTIVNRIWDILGSPTFAELNGRSIYDLIIAKDQRLAALEAENARLRAVRDAADTWIELLTHRGRFLDGVPGELMDALDTARKP